LNDKTIRMIFVNELTEKDRLMIWVSSSFMVVFLESFIVSGNA